MYMQQSGDSGCAFVASAALTGMQFAKPSVHRVTASLESNSVKDNPYMHDPGAEACQALTQEL